jgi:broad specificity phosphatase PhoE
MILMRHGQSEFNLHFSATKRDPGIPDPRLTPEGEAQAAAAAAALADQKIARIVVSPYTRALQTAAPIARALGVSVQVTPLVRERYHFTCDIGSPRSVLQAAWPHLDFGTLDEVWWPAETETAHSTMARAAAFRASMQALHDWKHTLLVSHWAFLLSFSGENLSNGAWTRLEHLDPPHFGTLPPALRADLPPSL